MNAPEMLATQSPAPDTQALVSYLPVPGYGVLPVNAFVLRAKEPMLVDTGLAALRDDFLKALGEAIDPSELRWIWITHADADHVGNLREVLDAAPRARLVTTYIGMAKMSLLGLPLDRAYLLNPGQSLELGDRRVTALRPPTFDAPETTALLDERTRVLFSADSFGALLSEPAESARAVPAQDLREGMRLWATIDAPWLAIADEAPFRATVAKVRRLQPSHVLSAHLPPAEGLTDRLCDVVDEARNAPAFEGPDQAALERMMAASA